MVSSIFLVDLDAFFASVEQRDNPGLKGKPVIVGALPGHRGVVSTCSYEARKFGLHSAMPISEAFRKCPQGIYLPVRMKNYVEASKIVMQILFEFTPDVRQLSIDEAMLDMTGTEKLWGGPEDAAKAIKNRIMEKTGLTISIGSSSSRYVAKIASGLKKPDGFLHVPQGSEREFMRALPLERLWGAGEKTRAALKSIGITSVAGLQDAPLARLSAKFGKSGAEFLKSAADGADPGIFPDEPKSRSMSAERTFEKDAHDRGTITDMMRLISDELAARIWEDSNSSCTLAVKIRYSDFTSITRQSTRSTCFSGSDEIYETAIALLDANWDGASGIRLIGIGLHGIGEEGTAQGELFVTGDPRAECARRTVQEIAKRGLGTLKRARFVKKDEHGT